MKADHLIAWLKAHPLINISAVAAAIGISPHSFHSVLRGQRTLPKKYVPLLEEVLKSYGFK